MQAFSFIRLIYEIFKRGDADIERIQRMGLLAVKIAQMFALRIDFLTPKKCVQLSTLLQANTTIDDAPFEVLIQQAGPEGMALMCDASALNPVPFASASVAQVHMGQVPQVGAVAVKLLKHDYVSRFESDVKQVSHFFKWAIFFYPKLRRVANPLAVLEMIEKDTLNELDLRREFAHHLKLKEIYETYKDQVDLSNLAFQNIYPQWLAKGLMVSEKIEGETFETLMNQGQLTYDQLLKLFHLHGFYVFSVGVFHGDLHPGNVMLAGGKIYWIDCGAIGTVSDRLRIGLFSFMKHLSDFDFLNCAKSLHAMSDIDLSKEAYKRFEDKFMDLYKDFAQKTVSEVSLTMQMMETIKLGVHSGMSFSRGMFPVIKSLMYLDGMVRRVNPDAILMKDMRPYVAQLEIFVAGGRG